MFVQGTTFVQNDVMSQPNMSNMCYYDLCCENGKLLSSALDVYIHLNDLSHPEEHIPSHWGQMKSSDRINIQIDLFQRSNPPSPSCLPVEIDLADCFSTWKPGRLQPTPKLQLNNDSERPSNNSDLWARPVSNWPSPSHQGPRWPN